MITTDTNRAQRIRRLLIFGEEHGLDRRKLMSMIGLTEAQISDPDARVPVIKSLKLWQLLAAAVPDPDIGLEVGNRYMVKETGIVGYAMLHSIHLLGALHRVERYAKLLNQNAEPYLVPGSKTWLLTTASRPLLDGFRPVVDEGVTAILTLLRELGQFRLEPIRIEYSYSKPADLNAHRRLTGADLVFDKEFPALLFRDHDLRSELATKNPDLTRYLDELAEIHLEALPRASTMQQRLRQALWPHLSEGSPSVAAVATELAVSPRTLQRRLREENTSFKQVLEELRKEKALLLLQDPMLTIYEVGFLLGYSEPSAFYRAFKRWHDSSPSQYRADYFS